MLTLSHHRRRRHGCASCVGLRCQSGVTLIELIVVIMILAIIIVPLSGALIVGFRVADTTEAGLQASLNRDHSSARWSEDVAAVDATGASTELARACTGPGLGVGETLLVSLTSSTLDEATGATVVRRSSWWSAGTSPHIKLIRRVCAGPLDTLSLTDAAETIVAEELGNPGDSRANVVVPMLGGGTNPCTEFQCGLNINGRYPYELRAERRTFGAGVPLEVGRLYNSSYTRQGGTDDGFRYQHRLLDNTAGAEELEFHNKLSLHPGLPGPSQLDVEFKVQQVTTGTWLTGSWNANAFGGTEGWVGGHYDPDTETWLIQLNTGTESRTALDVGSVNAGGEYKVYTRLTETGSSAAPKQYGGVAGFPLWFDWVPGSAVFVAPGGSDSNNGLTPATARATIKGGIQAARDASLPEVLVRGAAFNGQVNLVRADLPDNPAAPGFAGYLTVQGGMSVNWLRLGPKNDGSGVAWQSTINGSSLDVAHDPTTGIAMAQVTNLRLRQLEINSGTLPPGTPYDPLTWSTYGIRARDASDFSLEFSDVHAQAPLDVPGAEVIAPPTGGAAWKIECSGRRGTGATSNPNTPQVVTPESEIPNGAIREIDCTTPTAPTKGGYGGGGGTGGVFISGRSGRAGDDGVSGAAAGDGTPGGAGGAGGLGGAGAVACVDGGRDGLPGGGGSGGSAALTRAPAGYEPGQEPTAAGYGWISGRSRTGYSGGAGGAGGGSGGGGENQCDNGNDSGQQGASGGNGGRGGTGGQGGLGGGAAIGIFLDNSGLVHLHNTGVTAAPGGKGQDGGPGGRGGSGGAGGGARAEAGIDDLGGNSAGAGGGGGGGGGAGGNGGNSGPSVAIMVSDGPIPVADGGSPIADPWLVPYVHPSDVPPREVAHGGGVQPALGPGGALGAGTGGPAGNPDSDSIRIFGIPIYTENADPGIAGQAGQNDALTGRPGLPVKSCRIWRVEARAGETPTPPGGKCIRDGS